MKSTLAGLLEQAVAQLQQQQIIPQDIAVAIQLTRTRDAAHGDWATNLAMLLAKPCGQNPRQLAQHLLKALPAHRAIRTVDIAGPGFINFFVQADVGHSVIVDILQQGDQFGRQPRLHQSVQVEFVSANPTGPLHVGHGRGAAYGATLSNVLDAAGYDVQQEYYVNDAGRQMHILALSVWLRYVQLIDPSIKLPGNAYQGDYIVLIAQQIYQQAGAQYYSSDVQLQQPADLEDEQWLDSLIQQAQKRLGPQGYALFFDQALHSILADIQQDLAEFSVQFDHWFSEKSLSEGDDRVQQAVLRLQHSGHTYQQQGAVWFRSTAFGDDKDRVLRRENGQTTYFASDVAYHIDKFERGYSQIINIWGADHHGYIARVRAALQALGYDASRLQVPLVQFVNLYRQGQKLQMSTRSGSFVTLRALRDEIGNDAARFFYVMRKVDQPMDFDLTLAVSKTKDNPVYYIQYAHARVCQMLCKAQAQQMPWQPQVEPADLACLSLPAEQELIKALQGYPDLIVAAAQQYAPHRLAQGLYDLASLFHSYYNQPGIKVLADESALRQARLSLSQAVRQVLANGLAVLGVHAPEAM